MGRVWIGALEDVVNACEGEVRMLRLLAFAVRIETLAKVADALLEGTFFERGCFCSVWCWFVFVCLRQLGSDR